jgi:glycosyltransferase involved in cell wall biosynthesis
MRNVLLSAFSCNPDGVSEAYSAFQWIKQAEKYFNLEVITADSNKPGLEKTTLFNTRFKYINTNTRFKYINTNTRLKKIEVINKAIKFDYFRYNSKLKKISSQEVQRFDLVHHHTPMATRYANALSQKSKKFLIGPIGGSVPTPSSFHQIFKREPLYYQLRKLDRFRLSLDHGLKETYEKSAKILIVGEYLKTFLPAKWHSKCEIMCETGILADQFKPGADSNQKSSLKLLFVGRIMPTKGLELLLVAMKDLIGQHDIQLDVIGDGGDLSYCKKLARKLSIEKHVHFRGFMEKKAILRYYQQCDVFVFPSLREASGNVIFEAMSCAKPLIVSNAGGPGEVVKDDFGIKIDVKNYDQYIHDLVKALEWLIGLPDAKRIAMGQNARAEVLKKYDWDAKGKKIKKIYDDLIVL